MASVDVEARRAALRGSKLFAALQPDELEAVLAQAVVRRMPRNAVLLRRGDASTGALVIVAGRVRVSLISEDGREVTLGVLGPGEVLGEMSMLDGEEVSADVTTLEECVLLAVERSRLLRLLRGSSDMCLRLMAVLCQRLRLSNAALEDMALLDLPARLGRLLQRLARDYGKPAAHGVRIEVRLSQKDLATLVGASREKVNRQLREWEEAGVLDKDAGRIVIRRAEALASPAAPA